MKGISFVKLLCLLMVGYQIDAVEKSQESHQIAVASEKAFDLLKTLKSGFLPTHHREEAKMLQRKYEKHLAQGKEILGDVQSLNKEIEAENFVAIWCFFAMAFIAMLVTPEIRYSKK